ncbi:MAG: hypothetical protein KKB34_16410 [Bacteroidetes bacterium]|nr:hypothetical protein [Bacteroidota bacterium]
MSTNKRLLLNFPIIFILLFISCSVQKNSDNLNDKIEINFAGDAKIEIGSAYAGLEFHHSSCLPQRISFYYPVANSIDMSTDFWKRDTSYIMAVGIKTGSGKKEFIDPKNYKVSFTPYSADFTKTDSEKTIDISYHFTKNKPAFVVEFKITNNTIVTQQYEFYTLLEAALRTSHTFKMVDKAWTGYDEKQSTVFVNYEDKGTKQTQLFVINAGELPVDYSTKSSSDITPKEATDEWINNNQLTKDIIPKNSLNKPAVKYLYKKKLGPKESFIITQVIGTCFQNEAEELIKYLKTNYNKEIADYENEILKNITEKNKIGTGDTSLDKSAKWAMAMLEVNKHYIDGDIVPMPCPAEYNFYFAHDVLVTDLAAVNYDLERVKNNLNFLMKRSTKDHIIPHAYYWKDTTFATEYADRDNWNNYWINLVAASYLRHSNDKEFIKILYPYLTRSITNALKNLGKDSLMWSFRPDWWDIGKRYGSKTYMTALAIKTIEEYSYISASIGENLNLLNEYEKLSASMKKNLVSRLWSDKQNYLINYYEPAKIDTHLYIGSLLAAYYDMLDEQKSFELIKTAEKYLLDPNIGIYNAYPMDYEKLGDYLGFVGNEAGAKHYYFNGGIWPQGNAWYTLALIKNNQKEKAFNFIKNVMTLDGIMSGPNGQPAMYEVRNSNKGNPAEYGTVDKPNFMWAGAWYLKCLYNLFLLEDNTWNITFNPYLPVDTNDINFRLTVNGTKANVFVSGQGQSVSSIKYDGIAYPSLVVPKEIKNIKNIQIIMGNPDGPVISRTSSSLDRAQLKNYELTAVLKAFPGHENITEIISPWVPEQLSLNGKDYSKAMTYEKNGYEYQIKIKIEHSASREDVIKIRFRGES